MQGRNYDDPTVDTGDGDDIHGGEEVNSDVMLALEKNGLLPAGIKVRAAPKKKGKQINLHEELKIVQRPKRLTLAIVLSFGIFVNNLVILISIAALTIKYLDFDSASAFGPGLVIPGTIHADSAMVDIKLEQNALFKSHGQHSGVTVSAAVGMSAKVSLKKPGQAGRQEVATRWEFINDGSDKFVITKHGADAAGRGVSAPRQQFSPPSSARGWIV